MAKQPNQKGKASFKTHSRNRKVSNNRSRSQYKGDDDSSVRDKDFGSKGCNDVSWYAQDANLLMNVANFPWSMQAGLTYNDDATILIGGSANIKSRTHTTPGIMSLHVLPGLGSVAGEVDAPNIAANAMYVFIRHMNSGAKNYDAPDLMMYILAMDEVFTFINWCQRIYGTLGMYSTYNRYIPDTLLRMQGVDPDDFRENMVQFRYRLNTIIKQAATLVVPATFPIFERHAFLFRDYYIEGNDMRDQIYMMTPVSFRKFRVPTLGGPGELYYDYWRVNSGQFQYRLESSNLLTHTEVLDYLQDMVKAIYLEEDFGIMAGDILKAYGESKVVRLSELPDGYVCSLKQNNEVLLQIKNSNIAMGVWRMFDYDKPTLDPWSPAFGNIVQDPNTNIISENLTVLQNSISQFETLDQSHHMLTLEGDASPEMNMVMSRLIHDYWIHSVNATLTYLCGTEIVAYASICIDADPVAIMGFNTAVAAQAVINELSEIMRISSRLSVFKYHPCVYMVSLNTTPVTAVTDINEITRLYQIDNFTIIDTDMLDRLNQIAILSEFNVPHLALIS